MQQTVTGQRVFTVFYYDCDYDYDYEILTITLSDSKYLFIYNITPDLLTF